MREPIFESDGEVDPISCFDCGAPIVRADDDACVCCDCGGRNRRVARNVYGLPPPKYDLGVEIAAWLFVGGLIGLLWYLA